MNPQSHVSAEVNKDLIEFQLCKEFSCLPMELGKVPYKWIQKYLLYESAKRDGVAIKGAIDGAKTVSKSGSKTTFREL